MPSVMLGVLHGQQDAVRMLARQRCHLVAVQHHGWGLEVADQLLLLSRFSQDANTKSATRFPFFLVCS